MKVLPSCRGKWPLCITNWMLKFCRVLVFHDHGFRLPWLESAGSNEGNCHYHHFPLTDGGLEMMNLFFSFFFFFSFRFGAFGWVGRWAVCLLCCSVPSWSAFRLTTLKMAFSYYLVFPARALSFLFFLVFSCVSWLASCSSIHLSQMLPDINGWQLAKMKKSVPDMSLL